MSSFPIIEKDPWLAPYEHIIRARHEHFQKTEKQLIQETGSLKAFATGHLYFGLHHEKNRWVFREWAPNATEIFLIGVFSDWKPVKKYRLTPLQNGNWEIHLPEGDLHHGDLYKLLIRWEGGEGERIPSYTNRVVQDEQTKIFSAQVWDPETAYAWKHPSPQTKDEPPIIYESHVGMATEEQRTGTYNEFREQILPEVVAGGYNTLQLMAIQEHPYYGSFGYHVSSYFAPSSRFGTPDDLKRLVDEAHGMGLAVIMDLVHSHAVKNVTEGLGLFDGTPYQYFHEGPRREHIAWDSLCFNYGKPEVIHFLLSNCQYWLAEFGFDGFRFDGITSMLYLDHGLSRDFTDYSMYYDGGQDGDAITYLTLANRLIHEVKPAAITIAEEMSGMPGLAAPIDQGGMGFDYRLAMGTPDYWIKLIKEVPDEQWNVAQIFHELSQHRVEEKTIGYAESHDQALVGDKTIIFRLMDKEMYYHMNKSSTNLIVDRGMALHKMIRLITIATAGGGYLNFMGNEFGHPEWIDFPREGNNWSYFYARRQWSLKKNPSLKYHYLSDFDRDMIELIKQSGILHIPFPIAVVQNESDQVLAFIRGDLLFVFNFNPTRSFTDYGIPVPKGKYRVALYTDDRKYGGQHLIDTEMDYYTIPLAKLSDTQVLRIYITPRTGIVFAKMPVPRVK
ncbi:MAG: alpha amylase C-terminal domain-containing protein [Bacteroidales bacterium]